LYILKSPPPEYDETLGRRKEKKLIDLCCKKIVRNARKSRFETKGFQGQVAAAHFGRSKPEGNCRH
jgi:hypothetical protein